MKDQLDTVLKRNSERRTLYHVPLLHSVRNKYADEELPMTWVSSKYIYAHLGRLQLLTKWKCRTNGSTLRLVGVQNGSEEAIHTMPH
jgi:phosphoribosylformylglycinamidine (FGAM) synthase-like amidotransferase family enzyme